MKQLSIGDSIYDLQYHGIVSVPTVYGTKQALNLVFKTDKTVEVIRTEFSDQSKTKTIQVTDDSSIVTYGEFLNLDSTMSITRDGNNNIFSIQLYQDDNVTLAKQLLELNEELQKQLTQAKDELDVAKTSINSLQDVINELLMQEDK